MPRTTPSRSSRRPKGCVFLRKGKKVDVVDVDNTDGSNEIIYHGRHWFLDGGPF